MAEDAYERLISLPMFHSMTAQDVEDVIHAVTKIVDHYGKASRPAVGRACMPIGPIQAGRGMRVVAIIQARMGSTRLPGKVLKDLGGETVLARVVKRTRRATLLDEVVVATSVLPADDAIVRECEALKVACFRGDELDVLDRYYRAAQKFAADAIVRITSDCPLIDPELIDATIRSSLDRASRLRVKCIGLATYPRGLELKCLPQMPWRAPGALPKKSINGRTLLPTCTRTLNRSK